APQPLDSCVVECRNKTPSHWGVVIVEIACKFVFDKGSDPVDENQGKRTNIRGPNGVDYLSSRNTHLCVKGVWCLFRVRDSQGDYEDFDIWGDPPGPGQCATHYEFGLAPTAAVSDLLDRRQRLQIVHLNSNQLRKS